MALDVLLNILVLGHLTMWRNAIRKFFSAAVPTCLVSYTHPFHQHEH